MALKPLGEYVVATADEAETKTASGIYLPDSAAEKPKTAKVVAIGPNVEQLKVGDRILYKDGYGEGVAEKMKVDGVEYIIVKEKDVLATVEDK